MSQAAIRVREMRAEEGKWSMSMIDLTVRSLWCTSWIAPSFVTVLTASHWHDAVYCCTLSLARLSMRWQWYKPHVPQCRPAWRGLRLPQESYGRTCRAWTVSWSLLLSSTPRIIKRSQSVIHNAWITEPFERTGLARLQSESCWPEKWGATWKEKYTKIEK